MKRIILLASIAALVVSGCQKSKVTVSENETALLSVTTGVSLESSTKAIVDGTSMPDGSEIGVLVKKEDGTRYFEQPTNVKFTASNSGVTWTIDDANKFYLTPTTGKVLAYYPYIAPAESPARGVPNDAVYSTIPCSIPSSQEVDVAVNGSDYTYTDPTVDYMYGAGSDVSSAKTPTDKTQTAITLYHALSKVTFKFYLENYPGGAANLTSIKLENAESKINIQVDKATNATTMALADGVIAETEAGALTRTFESPGFHITAVSPNTDDVSILVVPVNPATPVTTATDITVTFTIDGQDYATNFPITSPATSILWEKGKNNVYTVKLSAATLSITSVTVIDWTDGQTGDINI